MDGVVSPAALHAAEGSFASHGIARRILVIFNPAAGHNSRPRFDQVIAILKETGCAVAVMETNAPGHAEALASAATNIDVIAAAGGDGTINEVVNGLAKNFYARDIAIGLIPLGTANVLADEIGLSRTPERIAQTLRQGVVRPIYVGRVNGRRFVMMAVARGTTFLKDALGTDVFGNGINIFEDPHRHRGLRSKPCDAEGLPNKARALIDKGVLTTWILDLRSARQLKLEPTGHAGRGTGSPPSPGTTNVWLEAGTRTPEELMSDIKEGLFVTDLVGQGVNGVTGDYSRGAVGFWIENGQLTYPVHEITVAGNLKDMFKRITPANDLELRYGVDAPTLRIDGLTLAGT